MDRVTAHGRYFRDAHGRARLFRGVNLSGRSKQPPFVPFDDPRDMAPLRDMGFNAIRLLVIWEAVEPQRGFIDREYLQRLSRFVEQAQRQGIGVLVDLHQDLFSRSLGGDGAPEWAVEHKGEAANGRYWFMHYFWSSAVGRNFAALWRDEGGLLQAYLDMVRQVVRHFRQHDNVIGYDLFNEPMSRKRDLATGTFERTWLPEFHRRCSEIVAEEDPGRLLFIEPSPLAAFGVPTALRRPPGNSMVFAPHLYDVAAIGAGRYLPQASTFPRALKVVRDWAERADMPLFIGEFGVLNGLTEARAMIEDECSLLDRDFVSWTAWHYNPTEQDWNDENASIVAPGGVDREFTSAFIRPYPEALAGEPLHWDSREARPWSLTYQAEDCGRPTEIRIPPRWSASPGIEVEGAEYEWDADRGVVRVDAPRQTRVTVRLSRS